MAKYTILESKSTNTGIWYKMKGEAADKPTGGWIGLNSEYIENDTGLTKYWVGGETPWATQAVQAGSGGSLPANFPAEGVSNANKFIGFDANGDYAALDAPEGGSDEPTAETILTLTVPQMSSSTESGVTLYGVQIAYADLTTEQKEAIADLHTNNYTLFYGETEMERATGGNSKMNVVMYRINADDYGMPIDSTKPFLTMSIPKDITTGDYYGVSISCGDDLSSETISFDGYITPDTSNSFYITVPDCDIEQLTCGTPDKTLSEIQAAMEAGKNIYAKLDFDQYFLVLPLASVGEDEGTIFIAMFDSYAGDGATLMFSINADGSSEGTELELVEAYSGPQYFQFTITESGGTYTATASNGDTNYGNIKDAVDADIPAYAKCTFGNLHLLMQFTSGDSATETANGVFMISNNPVVIAHCRIDVTANGVSCYVTPLSIAS